MKGSPRRLTHWLLTLCPLERFRGVIPDISVSVFLKLEHFGHDSTLSNLLTFRRCVQYDGESLKSLGNVEADVGNRVVDEGESCVEDLVADYGDIKGRSDGLQSAHPRSKTHCNGKDGSHAVKVVGVLAHGQHFRDDSVARPVDSEDLGQLLEIYGCSLADGEDGVTEPRHAEVTELVVEEADAELSSQERNVLDDGLAHTPLFVLGELHDRGQKSLSEQLNANN
jgi:hypothetical protein